MAITEGGALAGLITLTIIGVVLIVIISTMNLASGLMTLAFFVGLWSFYFGLAYVGLFAYNCTITSPDPTDDAANNANERALPASNELQPLTDDFLQELDSQLKAHDVAMYQPDRPPVPV